MHKHCAYCAELGKECCICAWAEQLPHSKIRKGKMPRENKFFYAYDPRVKRRVPHTKEGEYFISLVTGHKFREDKE